MSIDSNPCRPISIDSDSYRCTFCRHRLISIDVDRCRSILINTGRYWSMSLISLDTDRYRSISIGLAQNRSTSIDTATSVDIDWYYSSLYSSLFIRLEFDEPQVCRASSPMAFWNDHLYAGHLINPVEMGENTKIGPHCGPTLVFSPISTEPFFNVMLLSVDALCKLYLMYLKWMSKFLHLCQSRYIYVQSTEIESNQIKSNRIKSNQINSNQITSNQIKSIHHYSSNSSLMNHE